MCVHWIMRRAQTKRPLISSLSEVVRNIALKQTPIGAEVKNLIWVFCRSGSYA
jgi:hypothetical protein